MSYDITGHTYIHACVNKYVAHVNILRRFFLLLLFFFFLFIYNAIASDYSDKLRAIYNLVDDRLAPI